MAKIVSLLAPLALIVTAAYLVLYGGGRCATNIGGGGATPESIAGLTATTLKGETVKLESLAGKPMILDFWATWCGPCLQQRGELMKLSEELGDKVVIVALSVDDGPADVQGYLMKSPAMPHELMASSATAQAFHVESIPMLVIVDSTGKVREIGSGTHSVSEMKQMLAGL